MLVAAVPLGALAALGGAYPSSVFPLLVASALVFLVVQPGGVFARDERLLDGALVVFLAGIALQLVPWPGAAVETLAPSAVRLQGILQLDLPRSWRPLTIDDVMTRDGFASAVSAVLVFWAARGAFARGGVQTTCRLLVVAGGIAAAVGLLQRATAPTTLLWLWDPIDPGAKPFGPFVNRNHFATWLLMATALAVGCTAAHVHSRRLLAAPSARLRLHALLADGTSIVLALCALLTVLAMLSSGSRGAALGAMAAAALGLWLVRGRTASARGRAIGAFVVIALLAIGVFVNLERMAGRLIPGNEVSRATIRRETLPILRDFPLTGTGLGTYAQSMLVYQQSTSELLFNQAHNEYLQLAAEGGVLLVAPAFVALVAWLALARGRLSSDRHDSAWVRAGALAGMAGVAVQCVWESALRMPANAMLLALLAAMVVHAPHQGPQRTRRSDVSDNDHAPAPEALP